MASAQDRSGGRLAQLVERFLYTEDVGGSSPSAPTTVLLKCLGGTDEPLEIERLHDLGHEPGRKTSVDLRGDTGRGVA